MIQENKNSIGKAKINYKTNAEIEVKIVRWTYHFINCISPILVPRNHLATISPQWQSALWFCSINSEFFGELAVLRTELGKVQGEPGTCCHVQKQGSFQAVIGCVKQDIRTSCFEGAHAAQSRDDWRSTGGGDYSDWDTLNLRQPWVQNETPSRGKLGTKSHLSSLEVVIKTTSSFANW